jgi:PTH1 family peptidyl-tRNA hydrolase
MSADRHLVVGLGNPGEKYRFTRHNIAWLVLDAFAARVNWRGGGKGRDAAMVHAGRVLGLDFVVAKPTTFMNESGIAVRKLLASERVPLEQLLVVVDDFSLPFGALRLREGGSSGGHNGLASIAGELDTEKFPRLRIGIGDPTESGSAHQHVLGEFSLAERALLPQVAAAAGEAIEAWARDGLNKSATAFNGWAPTVETPGDGAAATPAPAAGEVDGPVGSDGIRKTTHGWRKPLVQRKAKPGDDAR